MSKKFSTLAKNKVDIDVSAKQEPFEWWRHTLGHGGVNMLPLPDKVVEGAKRLRPRLIRTFIQEYFNVYPEYGRFDWSRLDPYMNSLAETGAHVVASINIKPRALFPAIDSSIWKPANIKEWQSVIYELVKR